MPTHALPAPECLCDPRDGAQRPQRELECAWQVERPVRVGQRERLLLGQRVGVGVGVIHHVAASRLAAQPLGDVASVRLGAFGEVVGGYRSVCEAAVEPELIADNDATRGNGGAEIADELPEKRHQLVLVYGHDFLLGFGLSVMQATVRRPLAATLQPKCNGAHNTGP